MRPTKNYGGAGIAPRLFDDYIVIAGLFLVTLWAWGPNLYFGQAFMLVLIAFTALALMARNAAITPLGIYLCGWFGYLYLMISMGRIPGEALIQALDSLMFIMAGFMVYVVIKNGKISAESWMNAISILSIILAIVGLIQYFHGEGNTRATLGNRNFFAAFLAISAPSFFRKDRWVFLPLILGAMLAAKTSTAIMAVLLGSGFYFWGWKGSLLGMGPAIIYFSLFGTPGTFLERVSFWIDAAQKLSHSWHTILFGVGPGILWQATNLLHSEYVYLLWNFGLIGLALAAVYIFRSCRREIIDRRIFASFLIVLADAAGNHLFHTAPTAMLATAIFALNDRRI